MTEERKNLRSALLAAAAVFLVSAGLSAWSAARNFEGGLSHEFCQYAEIARNIRAGEGLRSRMVYPAALAALDARGVPGGDAWPLLERFPLHAWATAAAQALWGENDGASLALSGLTLALLASGTAAAGSLLWGPGAGLAAGLILALGPSFQRGFVLWGLSDLGFALLTLAAAGLLLALRGRSAAGWVWAAAGLLAGAAWMYRSNFMIWLPLFGWWIYKRGGAGRGLPRLLWWSGGFLLAAAPGMVYNWFWSGSLGQSTLPWNLSHRVVTENLPWLEYRVFTLGEPLRHPLLLAGKWWKLFLMHLKGWPGLWQFHLVWPAAAWGAFTLWRERRREGTAADGAALYLGMLAIQVFVFSFLRFEELGRAGGRYYLWFAPAAALLAARGAWALRPAARVTYLAAAFAYAGWWLATPQGAPAYPGRLPAKDWPELRLAAQAAGPGGLVATNLPGQMVWYARARAVQLPPDPAGLEAIMLRHKVDAVLLTRLPLGEPGNLPGWRAIATEDAALKAFCLKNGFGRVKDIGTSVILAR